MNLVVTNRSLAAELVYILFMISRRGIDSNRLIFKRELRQEIELVCLRSSPTIISATARSVEDETRNAELNGNRNPEWCGDFSRLVKIEKIKFLGISRYKVELRF